jgi:hypothetical protein
MALYELVLDDPEYIKARNKFTRRCEALTLVEYLRDEASVEFEAQRPQGDEKNEWLAFADDVLKELAETGLTDDDVGTILRAGDAASRGIDLKESANDFLGEP